MKDYFCHCTLFAGTDVYGLWSERVLPLHPSAAPDQSVGATVLCRISASHFAAFLFAAQVIGGLLLLSGIFVPLALTVLAAELLQHSCLPSHAVRRALLRRW